VTGSSGTVCWFAYRIIVHRHTYEYLYEDMHAYNYTYIKHTYMHYVNIHKRSVRKVMRNEFLRSLRSREGKGKCRSLTGGRPGIG
jgi:hypothetical protein